MDNAKAQFHIQELAVLKSEIGSLSNEVYALERFTLGGTVAVYAWLFANNVKGLESIAWWLPISLGILGALRVTSYFLRIRILGSYIRKIEATYGEKNLEGWHHYLDGLPYYGKLSPRSIPIHLPGLTMAFFWIAIIAMQFGAGLVFGRNPS